MRNIYDLENVGDILSGAWLQAMEEDEEGSGRFRVKFFKLVENEMVVRKMAECREPRCQVDHLVGLKQKYKFFYNQ